jgi:hypothetical protein
MAFYSGQMGVAFMLQIFALSRSKLIIAASQTHPQK